MSPLLPWIRTGEGKLGREIWGAGIHPSIGWLRFHFDFFQLQTIVVEVTSNDVEPMAEERAYDEQELGAKFDPSTGKRMYHNYEVLRVLPKTEEDLAVLRFLEKGDTTMS